MKNQETKVEIALPEGKFSSGTCSSCIYMDWGRKHDNGDGRYWCRKRETWIDPYSFGSCMLHRG